MIEINNLTANQINKNFLKKVAQKVLQGEKKTTTHPPHPPTPSAWAPTELSIALVGQTRIRELNKKYRKKNRVTDVLAFGKNQKSKTEFPFMETGGQKRTKFSSPIKNQKFIGPFLGEIVICLKEVKKNAKRYETTFEKELVRVLVHGILHLLGQNHEKSKRKAKDMEVKQNYYLKKIFKNF